MTTPTRNDVLDARINRSRLHALEYTDVSISMAGLKLIKKAARSVMRQNMPGSDPDRLTSAQALALFIDRVFWDEGSGKLFMCTDMGQTSFCLPIPPAHWSVPGTDGPLQ